MTGEVTLRGRVLPIGGLKEKLLAAKTAEVHTVLIPQQNVPELKKVPSEILEGMQIIPVEHIDQVLRLALELKKPEEFLVEKGKEELFKTIPVAAWAGDAIPKQRRRQKGGRRLAH